MALMITGGSCHLLFDVVGLVFAIATLYLIYAVMSSPDWIKSDDDLNTEY